MNFSVLALVDTVLMQMQKVFHEYSHGDLTAKVLSLGSFVLYGKPASDTISSRYSSQLYVFCLSTSLAHGLLYLTHTFKVLN